MYQTKKKGIVSIKDKKRRKKINLELATQEELKILFDLKYPFVEKKEEKKEPIKKK